MAKPARKNETIEFEEDLTDSTEAQSNESELLSDLEEMTDLDDEDLSVESANDSKYLCSRELRRKIEERQELKMLKDELGFDDFDLE